jgi:acyl-CoA reductase-like NAD-dependent aldehyde dehydrogenase
VLAIVNGGTATGAALGRHDDIDVVSITGGEQAGRAFLGVTIRMSGDSYV